MCIRFLEVETWLQVKSRSVSFTDMLAEAELSDALTIWRLTEFWRITVEPERTRRYIRHWSRAELSSLKTFVVMIPQQRICKISSDPTSIFLSKQYVSCVAFYLHEKPDRSISLGSLGALCLMSCRYGCWSGVWRRCCPDQQRNKG